MEVLSLFDGISCGQLALKKAKIPYNKYYASEIDKYAIQVTQHNFPKTIQLGDINEWEKWKISWSKIEVLLAGSPCQGFSSAGKQLNFEDPRSALFFVFVKILKKVRKHNPNVKFLLENVKMKKEHEAVITKLLGVEPIEINSALVSAQNRVRLYWTNLENIKIPRDKGILLKDIVENGVVDRDKSFCIDANYWEGGNLKSYFEKHRRQLVFNSCLQTSERGRRLTLDGTKRDDKNGIIVRGYEVRLDGKTCALTTVLKDNYLTQNYIIRKLTPLECERLQTVTEGYTSCVSNTQRYRQLGNGWTIDVVAHILKGLKNGLGTKI
jgi:DNA-cytosine methyltransferase